jgi:DNA-binding NtrC family response regulator
VDFDTGFRGDTMASDFRYEEQALTSASQTTVMGDFSRAAGKSTAPCVLVVDDEPLIRWSLSETLTDGGYFVVEAGDGQSALRAVEDAQRPIDVVLLDFRLPDSNDLGLLARLRVLLPKGRIIMMTAFGTQEMAQAARDLGAFDVLSKPFEIADLQSLVHAATAEPS